VLSELGRPLTPRVELHKDFRDLRVAPGAVRPSRGGGRWQSLNLLEFGGALGRELGVPDEIGRVGDVVLELLTGSGQEPLAWRAGDMDQYVLVLAGQLRCDLRDGAGELGTISARSGDFFLCPAGTEWRLAPEPSPGRRFIAVISRATAS
jgi:hypothetical protein